MNQLSLCTQPTQRIARVARVWVCWGVGDLLLISAKLTHTGMSQIVSEHKAPRPRMPFLPPLFSCHGATSAMEE